jgi:hypothetical protein
LVFVIKKPSDIDAYRTRRRPFDEKGDYDRATANSNKTVELDPDEA